MAFSWKSQRNLFRKTTTTTTDADAFEESEAVGVVFLECEDHECSMVDGYKDSHGWHFENRLNGEEYHSPLPGHSVNVLMVEVEECE